MSASLIPVAVIIPYFQRKPGLLKKAIYSVIHQKVNAEIQLIVIDDSSPIPAEAELAGIPDGWRNRIILSRVPNGGVSHARNLGLDRVRDDITYVAFLDSDDVWRPDHLARAIRALQNGDDFYFADFTRHDWNTSAFARCMTFHPKEHHPLDDAQGLFRFGGSFFEQVLRNNPIGTSTVVYRHERFRQLRFEEGLTISGEDILFWLEILYKNEGVVFSDQIECDYDAGVNICYDAKWGTEAGIQVAYNDILMLGIVLKRFQLSPESKQRLRNQRQTLSTALVEQALHRLLRAKLASLRWLARLFWHDRSICIRSTLEVLFSRRVRTLRPQTPSSKTPSA
ncbi:MAG: glycosyltransferase family A protein [Candidatus Acidiferrum sp.]